MADFGTFTVDDIMMHGIPKGHRGESSSDENFSDMPMPIGDEDKLYITLKIRGTLTGRARDVVEDASIGSTIPEHIRRLISGTETYVADSQEVARQLHGAQKWISNAGLVMVIRGKIDSEPCVVIAKMEHQEGMRVQPVIEDGKKTYKAEHLHDLILAQGSKVFKAGIFSSSGAIKGKLLSGLVADDQLSGRDVAEYFVNFLGCVFVRQADVMTEMFFDETHRLIARVAKDDPAKKADYEVALIVEMQSASKRISPKLFAARHLKGSDRDALLTRIEEIGLPTDGFRKDVALIAANIKRLKFQTTRGATLFVPPEMHNDGSLNVEKGEKGEKKSTITLVDEITNISGAGGAKKKQVKEGKSKEDENKKKDK